METSHLVMPLVEQNQAQKEVTVNEALIVLDAVVNCGVVDKDLSTPPVTPSNGDVYLVAASATDDWAGHEDEFAFFQDVWRFVIPNEGLTVWVNDEDKLYSWDGAAWVNSGGASLNQLQGVGIGTDFDMTNKLAVRSDAVLFTSDTGNVQAVLNKNAVGDTASYLFQQSYSGRAEFGLVGDDDFTLKVSPDGVSFLEVLRVDKTSAEMHLSTAFVLTDGISEPATESGKAKLYVDSADGDLKVKFGDGTIKTIVTD